MCPNPQKYPQTGVFLFLNVFEFLFFGFGGAFWIFGFFGGFCGFFFCFERILFKEDRVMFNKTYAAEYYYFYFTFFRSKVDFAAMR